MSDDSSSSDSDDFDIPLSQLGRKKPAVKKIESDSETEFVSEEEEEVYEEEEEEEEEEVEESEDESDDSNVPLSSLKASSSSKAKKATATSKIKLTENSNESHDETDDFIDDDEAESSSDDSDDYAISSLKSPKKKAKKKAPARAKAKKTKGKAKKKTPTKKKKKSAKTKKVSKSSLSSTGEGPLLASAELYAKCPKGKLVQAVLCRWWYAYTWPDPASLPKHPPKSYDSLDGFAGVYVCTSGDEVGKILDMRDRNTCPNFINFAKKTSEELRDMLVEAIGKQKKALIEAEGGGTKTEEDLKALLKWANKLNTVKTDKEAVKVLKASGLTLP